jgi:hypothetical protein
VARLALDRLAVEAAGDDERDAARVEVVEQAADGPRRFGQVRLDEHADASDGKFLHRPD